MFYCLHSFNDSLGIRSYMITRPLGCLQTIYAVCGKVSQLETTYYHSHYKGIAMLDRKLTRKPVMPDHCLIVSESDYIKTMYC